MLKRKRFRTLALLSCLFVPCATLAQTNLRFGGTVIPRRETVGVVSVFPRNRNEFQNIFRREPRITETLDVAKTRVRLGRLNQPAVMEFHPEARTKVGFESYVRQAEEQTIMLVGHNEKGEFRFADGGSLNLIEVDALFKEHNKRAIVLSCGANDYVPPGYPTATGTLTILNAVKMMDSIGKDLGGDTSLLGNTLNPEGNFTDRVQANINRIETFSRIESILKPTAITGALVGTGYAIDRKMRTRKR